METTFQAASSDLNMKLARTRIVHRAEAAALVYNGIWNDAGSPSGRAAVCMIDDETIELASGKDGVCDRVDALPFSVRRLSVAFGAGERPLRHADIGPMFSLVRLCAGPIGRVLRELGTERFTVPAPLSKTIVALASAWGYTERGVVDIDRVLLHALVPDVVATPDSALRRLGVERRDASLLGATLVTIDALADLLRLPTVFFSSRGAGDRIHRPSADDGGPRARSSG